MLIFFVTFIRLSVGMIFGDWLRFSSEIVSNVERCFLPYEFVTFLLWCAAIVEMLLLHLIMGFMHVKQVLVNHVFHAVLQRVSTCGCWHCPSTFLNTI